MKNVYTVSWVNSYIKNMISQDFLLKSLYVKGEASNVKYHNSGHLYFTLKDKDGVIQCIMFSYRQKKPDFTLKDGDEVIVFGTLNVYEKGGTYSIHVNKIEMSGMGALYEKYEKLKAELEESGMFDSSYKLPVPEYIQTIGVIAAYPGEAVYDIIAVATRRNPHIRIIIYPSYVQGEKAADQIEKGILTLQEKGVDIIIVARGGGSAEDLWAFNEKRVAYAFFDCKVPIISAIGHERHTPIADFVADLRASTPSAAAEMATKEIYVVFERLKEYRDRMSALLMYRLQNQRLMLDAMEKRMLGCSPGQKLIQKKQRLQHESEHLQYTMNTKLDGYKHKLALFSGRLEALSPLTKLSGGYAFIKNAEGQKITGAAMLHEQDEITLYYMDGSADAIIQNVRTDNSRTDQKPYTHIHGIK